MKVTGLRFPQLGEESSSRGATSVIFNTKENLRDLGKQTGLLTKFRIKKRDVSLSLLPNGCFRGLLGFYMHMLRHRRPIAMVKIKYILINFDQYLHVLHI